MREREREKDKREREKEVERQRQIVVVGRLATMVMAKGGKNEIRLQYEKEERKSLLPGPSSQE